MPYMTDNKLISPFTGSCDPKTTTTLTGMTNRDSDKRIKLNVGGIIFETLASTLSRQPGTRLAQLAHLQELDEAWSVQNQEYFFDRHPGVFIAILHFYRTEQLHADHNICGNVINAELEFWGLTELDIEPCCWGDYSKFKDNREMLMALDDNFTNETTWDITEEKRSKTKRIIHKVCQFMEEPDSSIGAKIQAIISMCFVFLSIGVYCLETHEWFRVTEDGHSDKELNETTCSCSSNGNVCTVTFKKIAKKNTVPHQAMVYVDYICVAYFSLEFVLRFSVTPRKLEFLRSFLNIIDVMCLLPHFISITLQSFGDIGTLLKIFIVMRIVRILRIFKLMKHYSAFKILAYTIKVSTRELFLLVIFLFTGVLIFACVIYHVEEETFSSIPIGFWWALVTMTTVGYGDKVPKTEFGYLVGSICALCGVLTVAFTVPIVVNNFTLYYSHAQSRIRLPHEKRNELKKKMSRRSKTSSKMDPDADSPINHMTSRLETELEPKPPDDSDQQIQIKSKLNITQPDPRPQSSGYYSGSSDQSSSNRGTVGSPVWSEGEPVTKSNRVSFTARDVKHIDFSLNESKNVAVADDLQMGGDRIKTISETVSETASDVFPDIPGTPLGSEDDKHELETRQLLNDLADAKLKLQLERKRQLNRINQKRVEKLQERSKVILARPAIAPGASSRSIR